MMQPVAPHAGAWIEIGFGSVCHRRGRGRPHAGAWIEIGLTFLTHIFILFGRKGTLMALLEIKGLQKAFKDVKAVNGVDLSIEAQEIHGILGPNGAGKSTTIGCLLGLIPYDSGKVVFENGVRIKKWSRNIGYVLRNRCMKWDCGSFIHRQKKIYFRRSGSGLSALCPDCAGRSFAEQKENSRNHQTSRTAFGTA